MHDWDHEVHRTSTQRHDGGVSGHEGGLVAIVDGSDMSVEARWRELVKRRHGDDGRDVRGGKEGCCDDTAHQMAHDDDVGIPRVCRISRWTRSPSRRLELTCGTWRYRHCDQLIAQPGPGSRRGNAPAKKSGGGMAREVNSGEEVYGTHIIVVRPMRLLNAFGGRAQHFPGRKGLGSPRLLGS